MCGQGSEIWRSAETFSRICLATGAEYVTKSTGLKLKDVQLGHLGSCKKVEILKGLSLLLVAREITKKLIVSRTLKLSWNRLKTSESVSVFKNASLVWPRGGYHPCWSRYRGRDIEKKHRIEDALEAVRSAQLEGIVPGGVALVRAIQRKRLGKVTKLLFLQQCRSLFDRWL